MMRTLTAWRRHLVCRDAVALMTAYLEGALSRGERVRLERHLADCDGCDEYLRQMRVTIAVLGRIEPEDLAPEAKAAMVELLVKFRAEEAGEANASDGGDGAATPGDGGDPDASEPGGAPDL